MAPLTSSQETMLGSHLNQLKSIQPDIRLLGVAGISRLSKSDPNLVGHLVTALKHEQHDIVVEGIIRALEAHKRSPSVAAALNGHGQRPRR